MPEEIEPLYQDGHVRVTRQSVSSPNLSHLVSDISGVRYEITKPERDQNEKSATDAAAYGGLFMLAGGILFFLLPPVGILLLLVAGGGALLSWWIRSHEPNYFLQPLTIFVTTSKGEILFYTWVFDPSHYKSDEMLKQKEAQESRCSTITDAVRRAIETGGRA